MPFFGVARFGKMAHRRSTPLGEPRGRSHPRRHRRGTVKAKNFRRDPRVGLSIVGFRNPYDEAMIRGRIVERRPDPDLEVMDEKEFPWRGSEGRVVLVRQRQSVRSVPGALMPRPYAST